MDAFAAFFADCFSWVLRSGGQASILIALIVVVRLMTPRRHSMKLYSALWLLLIVKMLSPWAPESGLSVFNLVQSAEEPGALVGSMDVRVEYGVSSLAVNPLTSESAVFPPEPAAGFFASLTAESYFRAGAMVWVFGLATFLGFVVLKYAAFTRRLRMEGRPADEGLSLLLEECKGVMGVTRPLELCVTDMTPSPALLGVFKSRLLIPRSMLTELSHDEWRCVFFHELGHLKRHDIPLNWLTTCLQAVHWFNPLVWYAFRRMRADREIACDALALASAGPGRSAQYAGAIVKLLTAYANPGRLAGVAAILENKSQLERRMKMIMRFNPTEQRWSLVPVFVLCAVALVGLTNARSAVDEAPVPRVTDESDALEYEIAAQSTEEESAPPEATVDPAVRERLDQIVSVDFTEMNLGNVINLLAEKAGLEVISEISVEGRVSLRLEQIPLITAIEGALKVSELGFIIEGKTIRIVRLDEETSEEEETATRAYKIQHGNGEEIVDRLSATFGDEADITYDARSETIITTDTPKLLDEVLAFINKLDEPIQVATAEDLRRHVRIEAMVVDVTMKEKGQSGLDWLIDAAFSWGDIEQRDGDGGAAANGKASRVRVAIFKDDVDVRAGISSQVKAGRAELLARPVITTVDGKMARISIAQEVPFQVLTQTTNGPPIATTIYKEVGTMLEMTPQITSRDRIVLDFMVEYSEFLGEDGDALRVIDRSQVESTVNLKSGQTVYVTGLRRSQNENGDDVELLMFLTCTIIESVS